MAHLVKATRAVLRVLPSPRPVSLVAIGRARPALALPVSGKITSFVSTPRFVSSTSTRESIIDPKNPSEPVEAPKVLRTPASINEAEYHKLADSFMEALLARLEGLEETRSDIDVEYSSGVMNIRFGDIGTYVINKQPPNKQIWVSSPKSGPKRFDYVIIGDGQQDKADWAYGEWAYLRDNTTLVDLLHDELGIYLDSQDGHYY